ncbi:MAG: hypothetical protein QM817_34585 [Archangium sp.]
MFIDTSRTSFALREDGRAWEAEFGAVYVKSQHLAVPLFDVEQLAQRKPKSWPARWVAEREHHAAVTSALRALELRGAHFVNSVAKFEVHLLKPLQSVVLQRAGVRVPASLTTNDAQAVRAFASEFGDVVYKTPAGGALVRRLTKEDLSARRLAALATAPVLFQQRIEGDEFRVTMLDGVCVGAWKLPARGVVDARLVMEQAKKVKCPAEVEKACARAAKALGLVFTSVDVRVSDEGVPYVLECNPTPSIASYEDARRSPVLRALARHLIERAGS